MNTRFCGSLNAILVTIALNAGGVCLPARAAPEGGKAATRSSRTFQSAVAIDTLTNTIVATIPIGQTPQAVVYVPDAVPTGPGTSNLVPLGQAGQALHVSLRPPAGKDSTARASVAINSLGLVDLLEIGASGLTPGMDYQLALVDSRTAPYGNRVPLVNLKANASGAQVAQAIGPLRQAVTNDAKAAKPSSARYLILSPVGSDEPVLVQKP